VRSQARAWEREKISIYVKRVRNPLYVKMRIAGREGFANPETLPKISLIENTRKELDYYKIPRGIQSAGLPILFRVPISG
jgi:hypothetical protein